MDRKIIINSYNASKLRSFRLQHNVKVKDLAAHIGKSNAYISKLERGDIHKISKSSLINITNYISGDDNGYNEFCKSVMESSNPEDSDANTLLLNYDLIECLIPVPDSLINYIQAKMEQLTISTDQLIDYINENEDIKEEVDSFQINKEKIEPNIWYEFIEADSNAQFHNFIVLHYSVSRLNAFLNGEIKKCEYMFPYALIYHLLKYEKGYKGVIVTESQIRELHIQAERTLWEHKFYSLLVKTKMLKQIQSEEEFHASLSNFDSTNYALLEKITSALAYLSSYDVEYTNTKLQSIVSNFETLDESFVLAYMALSLQNFKGTDPSVKKQFLSDLGKFINNYGINTDNFPYEKY